MRRFFPRLTFTLPVALLACGLSSIISAADQFVLQVPGRNDLTSSAERSGQKLVVTDWQNQTHIYERLPSLDTRDGRYLGYYSKTSGRSLRWPKNDTGAMFIGDAAGGNWKKSLQQVSAVRAAAGPPQVVTVRKPVTGPIQGGAIAGRRGQAVPMEVAFARAGERDLDVGYIGPKGDLQLYRGFRDQWKPREFANPSVLKSAGLIPGAPLQLVSQNGQSLPKAFTVNNHGQLVEIAGDRIRQVSQNVRFAPRSHFHLQSTNQGVNGFAVDTQGRLWDLDLTAGRQQVIDQQAGRFSAGAPISLVSQDIRGGNRDDLFLVDRQGILQNYTRAGGIWRGPNQVAAGFPPGASLAATTQPFGRDVQIRLAGVDARGQLQTLAQTHAGWQAVPVRGARLPPGSPLTFTQSGPYLALSGVGPGGVWQHWDNQSGAWNPMVVSRGFLAGAPVVADPFSQTLFSVDATGRLVTGGFWDDGWHSHLLLPGLNYAPPLVRRRIVPSTLAPAMVFFDNPSREELVVQMVDQFSPQPPVQFNIPPGGSVPQSIRRDGGGTLEEVYLVPTPGGWVEQVESYPLPPQPGPTIVAWAKRVTYTYIDPKRISVVGDFDMKNNVSLGVFELPPGEFLRTGDRFDVYREATARWNPGAAQFFGMPIPDADVGVRLYRNGPTNRPTQPPLAPENNPLPRNVPPVPSPPNSEPNQRDRENRPQGPALPPLPR